jgi:hypothetical protein
MFLLSRGLHVVKRYSREKGVDHLAIADSGNVLRLLRPRDRFNHPYAVALVELVSTGVEYRVFPDGLDENEWSVLDAVADEAAAIARFRWVQRNVQRLRYDPVLNNCEHFAWYIATGEKKSPQLRNAAGWAGVAVLAAIAFGGD